MAACRGGGATEGHAVDVLSARIICSLLPVHKPDRRRVC